MTKQKNQINGWLVIDKPLGMTSTGVGSALKRVLKPSKIGHIGTLDPLASGVLTFALGEATKLIPYWQIKEKQYEFHITFGEARTTDDAEGDVVAMSDIMPTMDTIRQHLKQFIGEIAQIPPNYSAVQINGKRSYSRARQGEVFTLPPRHVQIYDLTLIEAITNANNRTFSFVVTCGTGTYVRALARDIATACGTVGYVSHLRRIKDGCFSVTDAISLENADEILHNGKSLFPLSSVLDDILAVTVGKDDLKRLYLGQAIPRNAVIRQLDTRAADVLDSGIVQICGAHGLFAMGVIDADQLKPKRLLHLGEKDVDYY
jgi:tRNA pseudouridine55 synthase